MLLWSLEVMAYVQYPLLHPSVYCSCPVKQGSTCGSTAWLDAQFVYRFLVLLDFDPTSYHRFWDGGKRFLLEVRRLGTNNGWVS